MQVTNYAIGEPVIVIQYGVKMPAVKFYAAARVVVQHGERKGLRQNYPQGGSFAFGAGYTSVYCEVLPKTVSETLARAGKFPSGMRVDPNKITLIGLRGGGWLALHGEVWDSPQAHGMGPAKIVSRYGSGAAQSSMVAALQRIGVPKANVKDALRDIYVEFQASGR